MVRQTGACVFDAQGKIQKGVIVRHLLLPGKVREAKQIVQYLHETYGDRIYISLMNQYTPVTALENYPELTRKVTRREYDRLVDYAISLGVENAFIQEEIRRRKALSQCLGMHCEKQKGQLCRKRTERYKKEYHAKYKQDENRKTVQKSRCPYAKKMRRMPVYRYAL